MSPDLRAAFAAYKSILRCAKAHKSARGGVYDQREFDRLIEARAEFSLICRDLGRDEEVLKQRFRDRIAEKREDRKWGSGGRASVGGSSDGVPDNPSLTFMPAIIAGTLV